MVEECFAPCGQKLYRLSAEEAETLIRDKGADLGWSKVEIEQRVPIVRAGQTVIRQLPNPEAEINKTRLFNSLGFTISPGNVDCPPQCGNSSECPEVKL
jgi:hypothetical protein